MSQVKKTICSILGTTSLIVIFFAALFGLGFSNVAFWIIGIAVAIAVVAGAILFVDLGHSYDQGSYYNYGGLTSRHKEKRQDK